MFKKQKMRYDDVARGTVTEGEEHAVQGAITPEGPYEVHRDNFSDHFITYKGERYIDAGIGNDDIMNKIVKSMNKAYQQGFHDCSIETMNR